MIKIKNQYTGPFLNSVLAWLCQLRKTLYDYQIKWSLIYFLRWRLDIIFGKKFTSYLFNSLDNFVREVALRLERQKWWVRHMVLKDGTVLPTEILSLSRQFQIWMQIEPKKRISTPLTFWLISLFLEILRTCGTNNLKA